MKSISSCLEKILRVSMILCILCLSGTALALNVNSLESSINSEDSMHDSLKDSDRSQDDSEFHSALQSLRYAQTNRNSASLRSKSDVMQEVKNRYNGQVVRISLNERTAMYSVRVLLPNGKVKNLSISARK